ncbi:MAG: CapA family protein [Clostridia bacterium]|nr:CapA family protein [Clostridia bacterium]
MSNSNKKSITFCIILIAIVVLSASVSAFFRNRVKLVPATDNIQATTETKKQISTKKHNSKFDYSSLAEVLTESQGKSITEEMLKNAELSEETLQLLQSNAEKGEISRSAFHQLTGYSVSAFIDKFGGNTNSRDMGNNGKNSFVLGFTGDINFDETSYYVMVHALTKPNLVLDCIDENYQNEMKNADIMLINNEFTYTDRGSPTPDKKYTFRAKPEYVHYLNDMGVDIVSLANNHTYDYGYDSFVDTLSTLEGADIEYVGAGMNAEEANAAKFFIINGYRVAYIACSGVESPIKTPVATEDKPGICGSYYDGAEKVADTIRKAKAESDYVIVYPHWGFENMTELSAGQRENSRLWVDAGADAVIGNHSHCLQGMDYYKGSFIAYSLGNFWFNARNLYTGLLKLEISEEGIKPIFVAGTQYYRETSMLTDPAEQRKVYNLIESYPTINGVKIDDNGVISPK